ncbi:hypothetical protein EJ04DRAFT_97046 [Polyplosphaeria fusca]|uniref:Uncharacterized protein n=1 Tax=Polyplosphaeria fusca TaxID=682080 RepID=A0A9P4QLD0_9PLEO|nr:hypothetical protein EJ04DRAFT_97046 [Polyplosphaeria fusca]
MISISTLFACLLVLPYVSPGRVNRRVTSEGTASQSEILSSVLWPNSTISTATVSESSVDTTSATESISISSDQGTPSESASVSVTVSVCQLGKEAVAPRSADSHQEHVMDSVMDNMMDGEMITRRSRI